jgi:hypothetical protein
MDKNNIRKIEVDYVDLDQVEIPHIVYKYRSWGIGDLNADNVLLKNQLYMCAPSGFVDQFDCKIPTRYDLLTEDEIREWIREKLVWQHPKWNEATIQRELDYYEKRNAFYNKDEMRKYEEYEWRLYNDKSGILSLCIQPLNIKMWEMYGDNHKGVCYGFETINLIRECKMGGGGHVIYCKELPVIHPFEDLAIQANTRVYYKLIEWEFEEEYRIRTFAEENSNSSNRLKIYPDYVLKEVTLGKDMDEKRQKSIIGILNAREHKPKVFKCSIAESHLIREEIEY